jgi:hypothetical protein
MFANVPLIKKLALSWQIIPVYFVVVEVTYSVNHYITFNENESSFKRYLSILLFNPLSLMTIITHLRSMFRSPGYVPIPFTHYNDSKLPDLSSSNRNDNNDRNDLYCKKCQNPRPPRSHHCKVCKKCTLKMDHHCHWVANCVGYYNQKNFYQFLFYSTFGDLVGFLLLLNSFLSCDKDIKSNVPKGVVINSPFVLIYYMWTPIQLLISALCALSMTLGIGTLFYKQTKMLLNNQTTIDKKMYENWRNSPYYEVNQCKSFKSVMGNSIFSWFSLKFNGNDPYYSMQM